MVALLDRFMRSIYAWGTYGLSVRQCTNKLPVWRHCAISKWLPVALIDMPLLRVKGFKKDRFGYPAIFFVFCLNVNFISFSSMPSQKSGSPSSSVQRDALAETSVWKSARGAN